MTTKLAKKTEKTEKQEQNVADEKGINNLTTNDIFRLTDLYFYKKNYIFRHLYDSYNKFLEEDVKNFLENTNHIFNEKITDDIVYRRKFRFKNIRIIGPKLGNGIEPMFPSDARHRNLTYSIKIIADIQQLQEKIDINTNAKEEKLTGVQEQNVPIATLPLMIRSKYCSLTQYKGNDKNECDFNPGGYFIVNGSEKVIICQERMVENKPLVFLKKDSGVSSHIVQVNSRSYRPNGMMQVLNVKIKNDGIMTIRVPILQEVNVFVLFRILGIQSDKDIIDMIVSDMSDSDMIDIIRISLDSCKNEAGQKIQTIEEATDYLINKLRIARKYNETNPEVKNNQKKMLLNHLLKTSFIPHIEGGYKEKALYLGYMINKLLRVYLGRAEVDDRDSYLNKRVDLVGDLLMELFRQAFKIMMSECKKFFDNRNDNDEKPINIINQIKPNTIEQKIKTSLLTGAWIRKKGVAQMLQCYTYLQIIGFLRRVDAPSGDASSSKLIAPRQLHPSSVPFLCVVETPEHAKVGITKHLSIISSMTIMSYDQFLILKKILKDKTLNLNNLSLEEIHSMFKVLLNGEWVGSILNPNDLVAELISMKQKNMIDRQNVSIVADYTNGEIRVYCESGRFVRPVIAVKDNIIQVTNKQIDEISLNKSEKQNKITDWDEFLEKYPDSVYYLDSEAQPYYLIADKIQTVKTMKDKQLESIKHTKNVVDKISENRYNELYFEEYSFCEFHPQLLLGEIACGTPFCNRNPGPRNIFQYAQGRQAMGIYLTNYRDRTDISYILFHPHRPLITTRGSKYISSDILPSGENAMVGIICYTGYNQEDSLVFNKASLDRGLFRSASYKKYVSTAQKNQSTAQDDIFMKPDATKVIGMKPGSYDKLNDKGYIPEETPIYDGDIIIGKVTPIQSVENSNKQFKDASEVYKAHAPAVIDRVYIDIQNQDGYPTRKVLVRSMRTPKIGDKFCMPIDNFDVLTDKGWLKLDKITKKHKIATLIDGKKLSYEHPIDIYKFEYDGEMYKVRSQQVDLDVTMDHELYVKKEDHKHFELVEASKMIGKRYKFKKNCEEYDKPNIQTINIDGNDVEYDAYLELLGIFIADGCLNNNKICIAGEKQRKIEHLQDVARRLQVKVSSSKKPDGSHLNDLNLGCNHWITSKSLYDMFKPLNIGALNKFLPEYVWDLNMRQARILLNSLISCDGSHNKQGSVCYYTSSLKLANDVMRLAIHAGWSGSIKTIREEGTEYQIREDIGTINADTLSVRIIKTKNEPEMNHGHVHQQDGQSEEKYMYKGIVGCLEVPSHVFMIRQNNKNVWIGNCSRFGQKGTMGIQMAGIDMPHNKDGLKPDIILNPNAIPSRQTVGQLLESLIGKTAALDCCEADGTPFEDYDMTKIEKRLEELGYDPKGYEELYNGMTGEKLKVKIFYGPTFYQRLKHMVEDKIHCLTEDHEVLTLNGWKSIKDITVNDQVATLDNGELKYSNPTQIHHYENYSGKMYEIENSAISLNVTTNHRMFVSHDKNKYELVNAEEIVGKPIFYKKNCLNINVGIEDNEFEKLITTIHYNLYEFPDNIQLLSQKQSAELLLKYLTINDISDDTNQNYNENTLHMIKINKNEQLHVIDMLSKLALNSGVALNFSLTAVEFKGPSNYYEVVRIVDNHIPSHNNLDIYNKYYNNDIMKNELTIIEHVYDYTGPVYCISVQSEVFYIRRNGKTLWTGNSRPRGPKTSLVRQPPEGSVNCPCMSIKKTCKSRI